MSGSRHHFVPRFLQKGFASRRNGDDIFTYVFRVGKKPYESNTKNTGIESNFYTQPSGSEIDDNITTAEDGYSRLVNRLRIEKTVQIGDHEKIADLLTHFEVRTRNLRESFSRSGELLMNELMIFFEDHVRMKEFIQEYFLKNPSFLKDNIRKEFAKKRISDEVLEKIFPELMKNPEWMDSIIIEFSRQSSIFKKIIPEKMRAAAKSGHLQALSGEISPLLRRNKYEKLKFEIVEFETEFLPLGDSILVFQTGRNKIFKHFLDKDDEIEVVYLPLSSKILLVGVSEFSSTDFKILPEVIAQNSLEFFIANSKTDDYVLLQSKIGTQTDLISKKEIENIVGDIVTEIFQKTN